jgi:hypothetical protein
MKQTCAKDLRAFAPAAIRLSPDALSPGHSTRKTSQDFGGTGERGETGFPPSIQKTRFPSLTALAEKYFLTMTDTSGVNPLSSDMLNFMGVKIF